MSPIKIKPQKKTKGKKGEKEKSENFSFDPKNKTDFSTRMLEKFL